MLSYKIIHRITTDGNRQLSTMETFHWYCTVNPVFVAQKNVITLKLKKKWNDWWSYNQMARFWTIYVDRRTHRIMTRVHTHTHTQTPTTMRRLTQSCWCLVQCSIVATNRTNYDTRVAILRAAAQTKNKKTIVNLNTCDDVRNQFACGINDWNAKLKKSSSSNCKNKSTHYGG